MKALTIIISIVLLTMQAASARVTTLYPEAEPCEPSPFGTYCNIHPKTLPYRKYKTPVSCGGTVVYLTHRQKRVLDAMLRENRNVVLRIRFDREFVDAPCF